MTILEMLKKRLQTRKYNILECAEKREFQLLERLHGREQELEDLILWVESGTYGGESLTL